VGIGLGSRLLRNRNIIKETTPIKISKPIPTLIPMIDVSEV
ncbi:29217_t:CDS:1, partial [Gigaspora margarita]